MSESRDFAVAGFVVIPEVVASDKCDRLVAHVGEAGANGVSARAMLQQPWCLDLSADIVSDERIKPLLPADPVCAQCTLFDKNPERNWLVTLHQDLSIPVRARVDSSECSASSKSRGPAPRRVLHFVFGPRKLPLGLEWSSPGSIQRNTSVKPS
jgi:hypothetical protein